MNPVAKFNNKILLNFYSHLDLPGQNRFIRVCKQWWSLGILPMYAAKKAQVIARAAFLNWLLSGEKERKGKKSLSSSQLKTYVSTLQKVRAMSKQNDLFFGKMEIPSIKFSINQNFKKDREKYICFELEKYIEELILRRLEYDPFLISLYSFKGEYPIEYCIRNVHLKVSVKTCSYTSKYITRANLAGGGYKVFCGIMRSYPYLAKLNSIHCDLNLFNDLSLSKLSIFEEVLPLCQNVEMLTLMCGKADSKGENKKFRFLLNVLQKMPKLHTLHIFFDGKSTLHNDEAKGLASFLKNSSTINEVHLYCSTLPVKRGGAERLHTVLSKRKKTLKLVFRNFVIIPKTSLEYLKKIAASNPLVKIMNPWNETV